MTPEERALITEIGATDATLADRVADTIRAAVAAQREHDAALCETMPVFASPRDCAAVIRAQGTKQ